MRSAAIIEVEVAVDRGAGVADAVVGSQIDLLVFDAAPQPLDKDVVAPSSFAVHDDCNVIVSERAGEGRASELRSLVGVEDIWFAVTSQCILQRFDAECRLALMSPLSGARSILGLRKTRLHIASQQGVCAAACAT